MMQIKNLSELLKNYLGPDREFVDHTCANLTAPGENYGSLMLRVDVRVRNKTTNRDELVALVAKTPPPTEFARKLFNIEVTFKNEVEFYKTIWPTLRNFQEDHGAVPSNFVAGFAGARLNLNGSEVVDEDAVLLLENLAVEDFVLIPKDEGFDFGGTKAVLKDLATLHSTVVAFKMQHPGAFKDKVLPHLDGLIYGLNMKNYPLMCEEIVKSVQILPEQLASKAANLLGKTEILTTNNQFTTLVHSDLWVNNVMVKREERENKFVDYQMCRLQSPADDILFFLMTSVANTVILENLEALIVYYHEEFLKNLQQLNCDTANFGFDLLMEEFRNARYEQFFHIVGMLVPIFVEKNIAMDVDDFNGSKTNDPIFKISPKQEEKLSVVARCFEKMGWFE